MRSKNELRGSVSDLGVHTDSSTGIGVIVSITHGGASRIDADMVDERGNDATTIRCAKTRERNAQHVHKRLESE